MIGYIAGDHLSPMFLWVGLCIIGYLVVGALLLAIFSSVGGSLLRDA